MGLENSKYQLAKIQFLNNIKKKYSEKPLADSNKIILANVLYNYLIPENFEMWKGCYEPKDLVKHMSATYLAIMVSLYQRRGLSLVEVNAIEEATFSVLGFPKCWESDKRMYFIKKEEVDI